ncbi:MAG: hypothetical protein Q8P18_11685 [Pseudomonadota bacterium]|nr:hypothetical protein [Pseudomonadota bacterium]
MGDFIPGQGGGWTLVPSARHAMLLDASRNALAIGDHAAAVVLAEELLDEQPDDLDALLIVAAAAPSYGHGEVGAIAASQAARLGADVGALEAAALLAACQVERALSAANTALERQPADARAHFVRGIALDLLGEADQAKAAFVAAGAIDPAGYPPPLELPAEDWESLTFAATAALEPALRDALAGVTLDLVDLPALEVLRGLSPPPSPMVDALLLDPDARQPRIEIYRRNVLRGATSADDVEERIRRALHDEAELLLEDEDG